VDHIADLETWWGFLETMPMRYNGLVVETTNRCNAKCGMCYQSAGPRGSDVLGRATIQIEVLERCIREAVKIPTLTPRFHLAGGEAFIHLNECFHLFRMAADCGYLDITGTTNAYWGNSTSRATEVATQLRECGCTSMEISWDYWHMPFISAKAVSNALLACRDAGVDTNLRVLTTRSHGLAEALGALDPIAMAGANRISSGPVFPTGRAAKTIPREDIHASKSGIGGACHATLNLTVNSFGEVFPCCAGFDQTKSYLFGNIHSESIVTIAERINSDPIARTIVFGGVSSLLPILKRAGIDLGDNYSNICHLCWTIFSSDKSVAALRAHVEARRQSALEDALKWLKAAVAAA